MMDFLIPTAVLLLVVSGCGIHLVNSKYWMTGERHLIHAIITSVLAVSAAVATAFIMGVR